MKEVLNDAAEYAIVFEHFALLVFVDLIVKPLLLLLMYNVFLCISFRLFIVLLFPLNFLNWLILQINVLPDLTVYKINMTGVL
jgi:hypothetical protein